MASSDLSFYREDAMRSTYCVPLSVVSVWTCAVLVAVSCRGLSESAGRLPNAWMGVGMIFALLLASMVVVGACYLPERFPRIVSRLLQLVGMAGAFWSVGTLTRAIYT